MSDEYKDLENRSDLGIPLNLSDVDEEDIDDEEGEASTDFTSMLQHFYKNEKTLQQLIASDSISDVCFALDQIAEYIKINPNEVLSFLTDYGVMETLMDLCSGPFLIHMVRIVDIILDADEDIFSNFTKTPLFEVLLDEFEMGCMLIGKPESEIARKIIEKSPMCAAFLYSTNILEMVRLNKKGQNYSDICIAYDLIKSYQRNEKYEYFETPESKFVSAEKYKDYITGNAFIFPEKIIPQILNDYIDNYKNFKPDNQCKICTIITFTFMRLFNIEKFHNNIMITFSFDKLNLSAFLADGMKNNIPLVFNLLAIILSKIENNMSKKYQVAIENLASYVLENFDFLNNEIKAYCLPIITNSFFFPFLFDKIRVTDKLIGYINNEIFNGKQTSKYNSIICILTISLYYECCELLSADHIRVINEILASDEQDNTNTLYLINKIIKREAKNGSSFIDFLAENDFPDSLLACQESSFQEVSDAAELIFNLYFNIE